MISWNLWTSVECWRLNVCVVKRVMLIIDLKLASGTG